MSLIKAFDSLFNLESSILSLYGKRVRGNLYFAIFNQWWSLYWLAMWSDSRTTAQKMKIFVKDFFSKCDQIHRKLRIWSYLLKKSLMENLVFCAVVMLSKTVEHVSIYVTHKQYCSRKAKLVLKLSSNSHSTISVCP